MKTILGAAAFVLAVLMLAVVPVLASAADDVPDFWVSVGNGMDVYGVPGGQLVVPYVVAHVARAEVSCTLVIFTRRGPTETVVATLPMGTVTAEGKYFCNTASGGVLPFTFVWEPVTLDPGTYFGRVTADDGSSTVTTDYATPVQIMSAPDTTPPVDTTTNDAGSWHRLPCSLGFTIVDDPSGWGTWGCLAHVDYSRDGGVTWTRSYYVFFPRTKRLGGGGVHTILYRSTDAAGNEEQTTHSCEFHIDARAPRTTDDAPLAPQAGDVTVHLTAVDSMLGVNACSGVAATWYSVDGARWTEGSQVTVPAARNAGVHSIAYYSTDVAGNVESPKTCGVTIAASGVTAHAASSRLRR